MKVLDSSAMLAYLGGEPGHEMIRQLVEDGEALCAHSINLCEVFYDFLADSPVSDAEVAITTLRTDGITERSDMDGAFWRDVAFLISERRSHAPAPNKPRENPRLALGDACGLALSRRLGSEFLSSDRAELEPVHQAGLANVIFIR